MYQTSTLSTVLSVLILAILGPFGTAGSVYCLYQFAKRRQRLKRYVTEVHTAVLSLLVILVVVPVQTIRYIFSLMHFEVPRQVILTQSVLYCSLQVTLITNVAIIAMKRAKMIIRSERSYTPNDIMTGVSVSVPWIFGLTIGIPTTVLTLEDCQHMNANISHESSLTVQPFRPYLFNVIYLGLLFLSSLIIVGACISVRRHINSAIAASTAHDNALKDRVTTIGSLVKGLGDNLAVQFVTTNGRRTTVISSPLGNNEDAIARSRIFVDNWIAEKPTQERFKSVDTTSTLLSKDSRMGSLIGCTSSSLSANESQDCVSFSLINIPLAPQLQSFDTIEEDDEEIIVLSEDEIIERLSVRLSPRRNSSQLSNVSRSSGGSKGSTLSFPAKWMLGRRNDLSVDRQSHGSCVNFRGSCTSDCSSRETQEPQASASPNSKYSIEVEVVQICPSTQTDTDLDKANLRQRKLSRQNAEIKPDIPDNLEVDKGKNESHDSSTCTTEGHVECFNPDNQEVDKAKTESSDVSTCTTERGEECFKYSSASVKTKVGLCVDERFDNESISSRSSVNSSQPSFGPTSPTWSAKSHRARSTASDFLHIGSSASHCSKRWSSNSESSNICLPPLKHTRMGPSSVSLRSPTPCLQRWSRSTETRDLYKVARSLDTDEVTDTTYRVWSDPQESIAANEEVDTRPNENGHFEILTSDDKEENKNTENARALFERQRIANDVKTPVQIRVMRPSTEAVRYLQRRNGLVGRQIIMPEKLNDIAPKGDTVLPRASSTQPVLRKVTLPIIRSEQAEISEARVISETRHRSTVQGANSTRASFHRNTLRYKETVMRRFMLVFVVNILSQIPAVVLELSDVNTAEELYPNLLSVFQSISFTSFFLSPYLYVLGNKAIHKLMMIRGFY